MVHLFLKTYGPRIISIKFVMAPEQLGLGNVAEDMKAAIYF